MNPIMPAYVCELTVERNHQKSMYPLHLMYASLLHKIHYCHDIHRLHEHDTDLKQIVV